ncbi:ORC1-type DNA replication protein [Methanogenium marinum]|uniref:ORC1-type DNA replication protein n=1 Tax=Methanogenium marinum TaxID=348610 RepID=A0A9Q4KUW0_9EURY|nr:ORC1-type DNA replication protein [Methanogenium marinum]MDE4907746.1 ORC1-type DNA replication protein [Methanogenium marinum]
MNPNPDSLSGPGIRKDFSFHFHPARSTNIIPSSKPLNMSHHYLMNHQTLIRDAEVFEFNYTPDTIKYRDQELRQLAAALSPALQGGSPINANLRGPPGTGKTTCVRRIFKELEETMTGVMTVIINCESVNTPFRVFTAIFRRLFGYQPCLSGIAIQRLTDPIAEELMKRKMVLIVCLDDAHYLTHNDQLDRIIRSLARMYENYPGVKIGIVTTICDYTLCPAMVHVRSAYSVWQPMEIPFSHYQRREVRTILQDRIRMGLYPGVVPSIVLGRIVALTVKEGDLRLGIDLLKHAAIIAETDARTVVTEGDVTKAYDLACDIRQTNLLRALKPNEERLLSHIAMMKRECPAVPLTTGALYHSFKASRKVPYSSFYFWLRRLYELRFIDLHQRTVRGNSREVELRIEPKAMYEMCIS